MAAFLAATEGDPTFENLVAKNRHEGRVGDEVYEAIIDTATQSRYAPGTLSAVETTALYSQFERRMRDFDVELIGDTATDEERARILYELRNWLRAWTRELMSDGERVDWLEADKPNLTFEDLVDDLRVKGHDDDAIHVAIIEISIPSRASGTEAESANGRSSSDPLHAFSDNLAREQHELRESLDAQRMQVDEYKGCWRRKILNSPRSSRSGHSSSETGKMRSS